MLEQYYVKPSTIDRIRANWLAPQIEGYVQWMHNSGYADRSVYRRVPILCQFADFAREHGATDLASASLHVEAFASHWDVLPKACAPYRARTKGKDERGVGYVKRNAIAGHAFASMVALEAHLLWWMREVADSRVHGTTGEAPIARFREKEAAALRPLEGYTTFQPVRECVRSVQNDACVELETNSYSVPWRLIGEAVTVLVNEQVRILHAGQEVAVHTRWPASAARHSSASTWWVLWAPSRDRCRAGRRSLRGVPAVAAPPVGV